MKRNKLDTLATASALALVTFAAQAAAAGPMVYGRINVSYDNIDAEGAANLAARSTISPVDRWELNSNASRIGVKGSVDLDATGLSAVYQVEYEINVDDGDRGDSAFSQRNTFGGLQHDRYGRIVFGKIDTPLKSAEGKVDQFNDLRGDIDSLIGGQNRVSDIVLYSTPALAGGLTVNAAVTPGEDRDFDADGSPDDGPSDAYSVSVVYDKDGFYGALAYDSDQAARRSLDNISRADILRAVAGVKRGNIEAGALWQRSSDVRNGSSAEDDSWLVSGAYLFDKFKLKAQYGSSKADLTDEEGILAALGLDYALAKQSVLYGYWSQLDVDRAHHAGLDSLADTAFGIGVSHNF